MKYCTDKLAIGLASLVLAASAIGAVLFPSAASADQFDARKQQRIATCRAISPREYSTGMIFNSPGFETMFERSRCLQELAVGERDATLCADVRERKSLFFDGFGVSQQSCRARVDEAIAKDAQEVAALDFTAIHRLKSLEFSRNGNGTDFDLVVVTDGNYAGKYDLDIRISTPDSGGPVSVERKTYSYGGPNVPRHIFMRRSLLAERLGGSIEDLDMTVEVTLQLVKTQGNRLFYEAIPGDLRSSRLSVDLRLSELAPWRPEPVK